MKKRVLYIVGLLIPILFLFIILVQKNEQKMSKLIIRFDDYGAWVNKDWLDIERELLAIHENNKAKITISVVPKSLYSLTKHPLSPSFYPQSDSVALDNPYPLEPTSERVCNLLKASKAGFAEIAMHGYSHPKGFRNVRNSEFFGVDYDRQYRKIRDGKFILDSLFDTDVTVFVPPHNTYDDLTLDILSDNGFRYVSAKAAYEDAPINDQIGLTYIWQTADNFNSLWSKYRDSHYCSCGFIDVLLIHHTSFTDGNGQINEDLLVQYNEFLHYLNSNHIELIHFSDYNTKQTTNDVVKMLMFQSIGRLFNSSIASKVVLFKEKLPFDYEHYIILILFIFVLFVFTSLVGCWAIIKRLVKKSYLYTKPLFIVFALMMAFMILYWVILLINSYLSYPLGIWSVLLSKHSLICITGISVLSATLYSLNCNACDKKQK